MRQRNPRRTGAFPFKFNDAVLRHLTVKMKAAVTAPSPMMKEEKSKSLLGGGEVAAPAEPAAAA